MKITRVIFRTNRTDPKDTIACLPDIEDESGRGFLVVGLEYGSVSRGPGDKEWIMSFTRPATPDEYSHLIRILESDRYKNLQIEDWGLISQEESRRIIMKGTGAISLPTKERHT